jgi:hypothetical protein
VNCWDWPEAPLGVFLKRRSTSIETTEPKS